tara:strand:- start:110 stop:397 length:288 start_codon:yes stop_codon:yes gene_type:complete
MLYPVINLISTVIYLYTLVLLAWVILSLLISFDIVNRYQPLVQKIYTALNRMTEPALRPIRKFLPDLGGIDISPIILLLLLQFVNDMLYSVAGSV